ncbi:MAG TPA: hypothetical protein VHB73_04970 [Alphaproteobacteria bacterium]|nr:hypothetical protein [Alphaproteobacteria bacterium]
MKTRYYTVPALGLLMLGGCRQAPSPDSFAGRYDHLKSYERSAGGINTPEGRLEVFCPTAENDVTAGAAELRTGERTQRVEVRKTYDFSITPENAARLPAPSLKTSYKLAGLSLSHQFTPYARQDLEGKPMTAEALAKSEAAMARCETQDGAEYPLRRWRSPSLAETSVPCPFYSPARYAQKLSKVLTPRISAAQDMAGQITEVCKAGALQPYAAGLLARQMRLTP